FLRSGLGRQTWRRARASWTVRGAPMSDYRVPGRYSNTGAMLAALICAALTSSASAETLSLRYGQAYSAARSIFSLPVAIAEREGFFAREGLKVQILQPIPGGADNQITALHNDSVDLTHVATPFLIRAALGGSDAVAIVAEFNNPIYSV